VSLSQAHVRPIVRGKARYQFMAGPNQSGYLAIEPIDPRINEKEAIRAFSDLLVPNGWQPQGEPAIVEQRNQNYPRFKIIGIGVRKAAGSQGQGAALSPNG
jgi:hypothetical protein